MCSPRARGRRRDKGQRIQSTAEAQAGYRLNAAKAELANFCREHGLENF